MLLVCPSCATSYDVDPARLGAKGRQVRCVRCQTVWRAELSHAARLTAAAAALAPTAEDEAMAAAADAETVVTGPGGPAGEAPPSGGAPADRSFAAFPEAPVDEAGRETAAVDGDVGTVPALPGDTEAPPIAPVDFDVGRQAADEDSASLAGEPPGDIETVAARRAPRGAKRQRRLPSLSLLQAVILGLLIVDSAVIGWRKDIVRVLPQTASLYAAMWLPVNLRGVSFDGVATSMETREAVPILVVQGNIVNATGEAADVPHLKLIVRNAAKQEIYSWTTPPPLPVLQPYRAVGFLTRLASPPAGSHDVLVRFVTSRDALAGAN